ncbi:MAG: hypothetical protein E7633_05965 [Ruminococcaceae bacterium]|nr:hypothetical protein [Oscillospiraceae bacterium]
MLFTLVFTLLSCEAALDEPKTDEENQDDHSDSIELPILGEEGAGDDDPDFDFEDMQSFLDYLNSDKNTPSVAGSSYLNPKAYVDFSSIIPNEEAIYICSYNAKEQYYFVVYETEVGDMPFGVDVSIGYKDYFVDYFQKYKDYWIANYKVYNSLKDVPKDAERFACDIDGNYLLYGLYSYNGYGDVAEVIFMLGDYYFKIYTASPLSSVAQQELLNALFPSLGATDDSVIAMLDKIKALIPKE